MTFTLVAGNDKHWFCCNYEGTEYAVVLPVANWYAIKNGDYKAARPFIERLEMRILRHRESTVKPEFERIAWKQ